MKIGNFTKGFQVNNSRNNNNSINNASYPNLVPLKRDTVSFGSVCKISSLDELKRLEPEEIFKAIGIEVEKDKDGFLTLSHYCSCLRYDEKNKCYVSEPDSIHCDRYTKLKYFYEAGIDENKLLEKVKRIKGDADFGDCNATVLENLESIGGNADFRYSNIYRLPELKRIGGNASFVISHVNSMENLESIEGDVEIVDSELERLGDKFKRIGGNAAFDYPLSDLGGLEYIGGNVRCRNCTRVAEQLKNIKIGGKADIKVPIISDEEMKKKESDDAFRRFIHGNDGCCGGEDDTDFKTAMLSFDFR